jgi:hypothetical protein
LTSASLLHLAADISLLPNLETFVITDQSKICVEAELLFVLSRRQLRLQNGSTGGFSMGAQLGGYADDEHGSRTWDEVDRQLRAKAQMKWCYDKCGCMDDNRDDHKYEYDTDHVFREEEDDDTEYRTESESEEDEGDEGDKEPRKKPAREQIVKPLTPNKQAKLALWKKIKELAAGISRHSDVDCFDTMF